MATTPFKMLSRRSWIQRMRDRLDDISYNFRRSRRAQMILLALLLISGLGGGAWWYVATRPVPVPKVLVDDLEDALNFMLISDEFNKLSLAERRALLKDLIARMKGMGSEDSALMAAFAAGIMGPARAQLQKNAEKLMIDQWDDLARQYTQVPKDKRGEHLDKALVDMTKLAEDIGGFKLPGKEEDRPKQAKADAQRNRERNGNRVNNMKEDMAMAAAGAVVRGSEVTSPKQKARMALLMRDMTRHLRGENLDTGKPEAKPEDQAPKPGEEENPDDQDDPDTDPDKDPNAPAKPAPVKPAKAPAKGPQKEQLPPKPAPSGKP